MTVRRLARGVDDGYRSPLLPGLKSSADAERLAQELASSAGCLGLLSSDPPELYAEVAAADGELEERTWLALLIAYIGPLEEASPFRSIERVRTSWGSGADPDLEGIETGPRSVHDPTRPERTLTAYRAWAERAGSQAAAFTGQPEWSAERRFARTFERLALPGFHRAGRFALLVILGRTGVYELRPAALQLGAGDPVTLAAKRLLGIGDPLLLERRAGELASACGLPLDALDLALHNWERGERATLGLGIGAEPDPAALDSCRRALSL